MVDVGLIKYYANLVAPKKGIQVDFPLLGGNVEVEVEQVAEEPIPTTTAEIDDHVPHLLHPARLQAHLMLLPLLGSPCCPFIESISWRLRWLLFCSILGHE